MSKSSGYKNYKYKIFVENIRDLPFKNKSAKEQYKKAMINRNMDNDEIIITVLENYCKEVEQRFRRKGEINE